LWGRPWHSSQKPKTYQGGSSCQFSHLIQWFCLKNNGDHAIPCFKTSISTKCQLVGGFNPSEKYDSQLDDYSQYMEKNMFQTTNQPIMATNLGFIDVVVPESWSRQK